MFIIIIMLCGFRHEARLYSATYMSCYWKIGLCDE